MTPAHIDNLWQRAVRRSRESGAITMHVFAEIVRREAFNDAIDEAARAVESWAMGPAMVRVCRAIAKHVLALKQE